MLLMSEEFECSTRRRADLGGCPFAPGAAGNLATERLIEHLDSRGIPHGVDIDIVRRAIANLLASPLA